MPALKLWYAPGACSLAVHILLKEIGASFEPIVIGPNASQESLDQFRTVNPKMRVPILVIDEHPITETPAIMTAISQLAPERQLFGTTALEVVRCYEWLNWLSGTVHGQGFGGLFRPARFADDSSMHAEIQRKGWETVLECFGRIESGLDGVHAVGAGFTVVDPYLFVFWRWGVERGADMEGRYPRYARLVAELVKREGVVAALEAEGIEASAPGL